MRAAIESIRHRLQSQGIRGMQIHEIREPAPFLVFMKKIRTVGMELCVPFEHQGHDNRNVKHAVGLGRYPANERLQRLVNDHLADQTLLHRGRNWEVRLVPWMENGRHIGYAAQYRGNLGA